MKLWLVADVLFWQLIEAFNGLLATLHVDILVWPEENFPRATLSTSP